MKLVRK
jgi:hypothetical protein